MTDQAYYTLRDVLDTIPNGYPSTEDGLEIKILEKVFTGEEAGLAASNYAARVDASLCTACGP